PYEHLANLNTPAIAISPDGANVVYIASRGSGPAQIFRRPLDALKAEPIAGTEDAAAPFFSPDGQWMAFFANGKLKKIAAGGGAAIDLCPAAGPLSLGGGTWGPNNTIWFQRTAGWFFEVSASGGTPHRSTSGARQKHQYWRWPELMSNGRAILFAGGSAGFSF